MRSFRSDASLSEYLSKLYKHSTQSACVIHKETTMASVCINECFEITYSDSLFQYGLQIIGEDGRLKNIQKDKLVYMKDVECYSLRLFSKSMKTDVGHNIPYAKITIDGKKLGHFYLNEPIVDIDRFPSNGDILCFVVCHTDEQRRSTRRHSKTPAFQNIPSDKHMGLVIVEFGFCQNTSYQTIGGEEAYIKLKTDELPEPLKISSRDVGPILETLNVRRAETDEPDCEVKQIQTVQGGTLRLGNHNTTAMADRMFTTCGIRNSILSASISFRLVGTSDSSLRRSRNNTDLVVKGIEGNRLHHEWNSFCHFPPTADISY